MKQEANDYDVFKDSPMRYLGYANELGEAFRAFIPKSVVIGSYGVASLYAVGDAVDKGYKAYRDTSKPNRNWRVAQRTLDTGIWQLLASVTVPAFIINRVVYTTNWSLQRFVSPNSAFRASKIFRILPTMIGLAVIPVLPYVLDPLIDKAMDHSVRPLFTKIMEKRLQQKKLEIEQE
jgi:fission process protein 1